MIRLQFLRTVALVLGIAFSWHAFAQATLTVTATVASTCLVTGGALVFGNYSGAQTDASTPVTATCTNGSTAYILLSQGANAASGSSDSLPLRQMAGPSSGVLSYGLFQNAGASTVWGNNTASGKVVNGNGLLQTLTVYGRIPAGQYGAPAGLYTDTVQVNFTF